ncbi:Oligopeptide transporter, OPT family [Pseudomonas sp. R3-18-08]|nr:Oligopeptide transporter, OPT family [Pseudomonas sp. R3-18-08]
MHPISSTQPVERELSLRAVITGILLGILLTPSNVYAGLKIGWSFNMSIIALLIGYAVWQGLAKRSAAAVPWTLHESNINQTVASAAASIISGGLVAPIPAYTLLTGNQLEAIPMIAWVFSVSFLGIWIAWYLRPSLLNDKALKFPEGMATLETLLHIYNHGREAATRLKVLLSAAILSGLVKWVDTFLWALPRWSPTAQLERLTFSADPSLLLLGFGGIIGIRVGLTLLLGAVLAWGGLGPWLLAQGLVNIPAGSSGPQFAALVEWLLWPGVSLMVCSTLASLAIRLWALHRSTKAGGGTPWTLPKPGPAAGFILAIGLVVSLQALLFGINLWMALLTIPLAICLAAVAARVVGATGIPPIGAIGQLSQLSFGIVAPGAGADQPDERQHGRRFGRAMHGLDERLQGGQGDWRHATQAGYRANPGDFRRQHRRRIRLPGTDPRPPEHAAHRAMAGPGRGHLESRGANPDPRAGLTVAEHSLGDCHRGLDRCSAGCARQHVACRSCPLSAQRCGIGTGVCIAGLRVADDGVGGGGDLGDQLPLAKPYRAFCDYRSGRAYRRREHHRRRGFLVADDDAGGLTHERCVSRQVELFVDVRHS